MTERKTKRPALRRAATIGLAAALVLALGSVAYASDLGGIQRTVQLWLNGEMTDARPMVAARRSAGRFVFRSVIFITSVIVSGEACSGANAR